MKYRKKPVVIEAVRWFRVGDHQAVHKYQISDYLASTEPDPSPWRNCKQCNQSMEKHGWITTLEGGHIVCPGDWIIKGVKAEHYPCKPDVFEQTYEQAEDVDE